MIDHTHDPVARTWLRRAGGRATGPTVERRLCVRRADAAVRRLLACLVTTRRVASASGSRGRSSTSRRRSELGLIDDLDGALEPALCASRLNPLLALSPQHWTALRHRLFALLVDDADGWRGARDLVRHCLVPMAAVRMHLPFDIGDYTDFYASIHHATNVGTMLRPEQPLYPNYRHVPDRLSRACLVDRRQWHADSSSVRADAAAGCRGARSSGRRSASTTNSKSGW